MLSTSAVVAAVLLTGPARAECVLDSVETEVRLAKRRRTDTLWFTVGTGHVDCAVLPLGDAGPGTPVSVRTLIRRGELPSERNTGVLSSRQVGGSLEPVVVLAGLRPEDIVRVDIERVLDGPRTVWQPGPVRGFAELTYKGAAPDVAELPAIKGGWFADSAWLAAHPEAVVRWGAPVPQAGPASPSIQPAKVEIELLPEVSTPAGEPPLGRHRTTWTLSTNSAGRLAVPWPPDTTDHVCTTQADGAELSPDWRGCTVHAPPGTPVTVGWSSDRLLLAGEVGPASLGGPLPPTTGLSPLWTSAAAPSTPSVTGPTWSQQGTDVGPLHPTGPVDVVLRGEGVGFAVQVSGEGEAVGDGTVQARLPAWSGGQGAAVAPRVAWRVVSIHGQPVLADADRVQQAVARTALHASLPEPGLPPRLKGQVGEERMVPELVALVRRQVRPGRLPGDRSLQPRNLLTVRKSSHATEWESALLLARYLRQIKLEAVPVPVRPVGGGALSRAMPAGFDAAVVRLTLSDGTVQWLDPSCPVCAPGEVRPELWGGVALSSAVDALPASPPGAVHERIEIGEDGVQHVVFEYSGPAATALRLWLLDVPVSERSAALRQLHGADRLTGHEGLADPGAPVVLQLERRDLLDTALMGSLSLPPGEVLRLPWSGTRTWQLQAAPDSFPVEVGPASSAEVPDRGLSWERTVSATAEGHTVVTEVLEVEGPALRRVDWDALIERIEAQTAPTIEVPITPEPIDGAAPAAQPDASAPANEGSAGAP